MFLNFKKSLLRMRQIKTLPP